MYLVSVLKFLPTAPVPVFQLSRVFSYFIQKIAVHQSSAEKWRDPLALTFREGKIQ